MQQHNNSAIIGVTLIAFLVIVFTGPMLNAARAQPVLSAESISLGGGGTAYLSGFETALLNPANLAIPSHKGNLHIGLGHIGLSYDPILSSSSAYRQFTNFRDSFYPYEPGINIISGTQRSDLLAENYAGNGIKSQHINRADLIVGGVLWQREEEAFSFGIRARTGSRVETGRGWYSPEFQDSDDERIRDFTLNQQKQQLYEFSFGYAREFTLINGLIPRLSKLYIGIAPKLIVSGMYHDLKYDARYSIAENGEVVYNSRFSYDATGDFSRTATTYMVSGNAEEAVSRSLNRKLIGVAGGYGIGFDFGLTYLVPLGGDLPTESVNPSRAKVNKSLRLSFSVTDIGAIRYQDEPLQLTAGDDSLRLGQETVSQSLYTGAGGQYLAYFEEASVLPNPFLNTTSQNRSGFTTMLPTSLNAGMLFELNRLKLLSDLSVGLQNTAFTTTRLAVHLGMEIRPLPQVPLRAGTHIASGTPVNFGFGTGFESRYWDLNIGTQIIIRSHTFTSELAGGAFAGIQIHL